MSWKKYFTRARRSADFDNELEAHLAHEIDGLLATGMSAAAARQAALRKLGNVTALREWDYQRNTLNFLDGCWQDLRQAIRQLRFSPGYAAVTILSLALGTGVNAAIFQLIDAVRLRALPVRHPGELVELSIPKPRRRTGDFTGWPSEFNNPVWERIRDRQRGFSGLLAWSMDRVNLAPSGQARFAQGMWVSGDFFRVLGVEPIVGRTFTAAEDNRDCTTGAVISHAFWQREFGGDPMILSRQITVNTVRFPVLGVAPPAFLGLDVGRRFDIALPLCAERIVDGSDVNIDDATHWWLGVMGRLKLGWSVEQARAQLSAIAPEVFASTLPKHHDPQFAKDYLALRLTANRASTGNSEFRRSYETPLWLLLGASGLVLAIACANLASIALARASGRTREIAVRLAVGASRVRILRQLLAESLVLASLGCAGGLILGAFMSRALTGFFGRTLFLDLSMDWRMALFAASLAVASCLLFGLAPSLRAARTDCGLAQTASGRGIAGTRAGLGTRRGLAIVQIALSLVLVTAAAIFIGGFRMLLTQDPGFRADGVVVVMADISGAQMPAAQHAPYFLHLLERMQVSGAVADAASVAVRPIGGGTWNVPVSVDAADSGHPAEGESYMNEVTSGYFQAMRTPIVAGRNFNAGDNPQSPKVAIVNRAFVKRYLRGADPIGKHFRRTGGLADGEFQIIGVAADAKYASLREEMRPEAYRDGAQNANWDTEAAFMVRSKGAAANTVAAVKQAAQDTEPHPILDIQMFQQSIDDSLQKERLMASLSGFYGGLAALLAAIGVYGALSYLVAQRRHEIGVRMALGASRSAVVGMILRETAGMAVTGLAIGAALTYLGMRAASSLIYGVEPLGGAAIIVASAGLIALALLASFLPARRATGIDPAGALRQE